MWLSPWFLSNYYHRYTRPIDFEFYKRLRKPIAKSLYTLLENGWYAAEGKPYKSANGTDYIITYYPGQKFFDDQQAKDARRQLAEQINNW